MSSNSNGSGGEGPPIGDAVIAGRTARLAIDTSTYRVTAVQKAAYRLASRFTVALGLLDANVLPVTFTFPEATTEGKARELVRLFYQELLDQELREKLSDETRAVRALLLAQAFSKTDLIRDD